MVQIGDYVDNEDPHVKRKKYQFTEDVIHGEHQSYIADSQRDLNDGSSESSSDESGSESSSEDKLTKPRNQMDVLSGDILTVDKDGLESLKMGEEAIGGKRKKKRDGKNHISKSMANV